MIKVVRYLRYNPSPHIHNVFAGNSRFQVRVEPLHSLQKRRLLGILDRLVLYVTTNSEAMLNATEQVDLPGLTCLGKYAL